MKTHHQSPIRSTGYGGMNRLEDFPLWQRPAEPVQPTPVNHAPENSIENLSGPAEGEPVSTHHACDATPELTGAAAQTPSPAPPPIAPSILQSPALHRPLRQCVELWLKRERIPYILVDEAKKALFAGAKLRSFHFVAYRRQGPNWLIWAGNVTAEIRQEMLQWENIFGDGFKAVLTRPSRTNPLGFTTKTLADELIQW
jgi:hypothetical protein